MIIEMKSHQEFPYDALKKGILVMPVNLQGLMEFTKINRRFKHEYPKTYQEYIRDCIFKDIAPGEIKVYEENGMIITLLFYRMFEIGRLAETESPLRSDLNLVQCLNALFRRFPDGMNFFSPRLPYETFKNSQMKIVHHETTSKWFVLPE